MRSSSFLQFSWELRYKNLLQRWLISWQEKELKNLDLFWKFAHNINEKRTKQILPYFDLVQQNSLRFFFGNFFTCNSLRIFILETFSTALSVSCSKLPKILKFKQIHFFRHPQVSDRQLSMFWVSYWSLTCNQALATTQVNQSSKFGWVWHKENNKPEQTFFLTMCVLFGLKVFTENFDSPCLKGCVNSWKLSFFWWLIVGH